MSKYKKFKKIGQFKDIIHSLKLQQQFIGKDEDGVAQYDLTIVPRGVIKFIGRPKIHGSNSSICYSAATDDLKIGRREGFVEFGESFYGFDNWAYNLNQNWLKDELSKFCSQHGFEKISVFGEWAGAGVQKTVAISEFPKAFYAFAVWVHDDSFEDGGYYAKKGALNDISRNESIGFFNILDFPFHEVEVDIEFPALAVEKFNELTDAADKVCPVAKQRAEKEGKELKSKIGEGFVWSNEDYSIVFKTKGSSHGNKGSKKMATLDPIKAKNIKEFVEKTVTEDRLEQFWQIFEQEHGIITRKLTGDFVRAVNNDVASEESDGMVASNLERKDVGAAISTAARCWLFKKIDSSF